MKIIILSAAYPFRGGIAHFTGLLYKELVKEHQVEVVTFKRQYPSFLFPGSTQKEPDNDDVQKIPAEELVDSINPLNWLITGIKIKNRKPDLLIINFWLPFFGPSFGTIARIVKGNNGTRIITVCHNIIPHEPKIGDRIFTRFLFNAVDNFILLAKKLEEDLKILKIDARFKTLYHPVYSVFGGGTSKYEAREFLKVKGERVILFFGFIREYKGLDTLLEAFALVKDKLNLKLIVAGEFYSNRDKYIELIDRLNLKGDLYLFDSFIPSSEVKYYFSAADVVVLPYKNATQSGIVQIANNFNKPVIATDVGGLGEVVFDNKTGFLVAKDNPVKLADAVQKFYDENKEPGFVENIKAEAKKFSWENFVNGVMGILEIK